MPDVLGGRRSNNSPIVSGMEGLLEPMAPFNISGMGLPQSDRTPGTGPGGLGGIVNGLFTSLFSSPAGRGGAALSQMGDFDVDSFVEGTLSQAQNKDPGNLAQSIGRLIRMIGI